MTERLAVYFDTEDHAQRVIPQLQACGARDIIVERLAGEAAEEEPFFAGYNRNLPSSYLNTIPSTGTLPSVGGVYAANGAFGSNLDSDRRQEGRSSGYLLECEVTSELAPQAIALLLKHGAKLSE